MLCYSWNCFISEPCPPSSVVKTTQSSRMWICFCSKMKGEGHPVNYWTECWRMARIRVRCVSVPCPFTWGWKQIQFLKCVGLKY